MLKIGRLIVSGTKRFFHLTSDDPRELEQAAYVLRQPIKVCEGRNKKHINVSEKKRSFLVSMGAKDER